MKLALISLGCSKNLVDSENSLSQMEESSEDSRVYERKKKQRCYDGTLVREPAIPIAGSSACSP